MSARAKDLKISCGKIFSSGRDCVLSQQARASAELLGIAEPFRSLTFTSLLFPSTRVLFSPHGT